MSLIIAKKDNVTGKMIVGADIRTTMARKYYYEKDMPKIWLTSNYADVKEEIPVVIGCSGRTSNLTLVKDIDPIIDWSAVHNVNNITYTEAHRACKQIKNYIISNMCTKEKEELFLSILIATPTQVITMEKLATIHISNDMGCIGQTLDVLIAERAINIMMQKYLIREIATRDYIQTILEIISGCNNTVSEPFDFLEI